MQHLLADTNPFGSQGTLQPAVENAYTTGSATSAQQALTNGERIITNALGLLTIVAALAFLLYFVMAGLNWISAGGDTGKVQKAREQMVSAVIGMIVIVISYGLIGVIGQFLGINILTPASLIYSSLNPTKAP